MNNELKKELLRHNSKPLRILDLGCGSPTSFFYLFKEFKEDNNAFFYKGIDEANEFDVFKGIVGLKLPVEDEIEIDDWVNKFNGLCSEDVNYTYVIDAETFDNYFKFHFKTNILDYLKNISSEEKFDAIILSNILHKIEIADVPFIMEACRSMMNENAIIYICVLGINYKGEEDENNKLFTLERYNSLKENFNIFWNKENEDCHLEFIGRMK